MIRRQAGYTAVLLLGLHYLLAAPALCKGVELKSVFRDTPVMIDGKRDDWASDGIVYLAEQEISFACANDTDRLYLLVSHRKPQYAALIRMSGLTIWLDPTGRKKKTFMLRLVDGPSPDDLRALREQNGEKAEGNGAPMVRERMQQLMESRPPSFTCFEKDVIIEKLIPTDGSEGPSAAHGIDNGFVIYEFSIPLDSSEIRHYGIAGEAGTPISIGLVWGEINKEDLFGGERPSMMPSGGSQPPEGMPGGGMGGGFPGGPGGGPGGGFGGGRMMRGGGGLPEKQEVWIKATLADLSSDQ